MSAMVPEVVDYGGSSSEDNVGLSSSKDMDVSSSSSENESCMQAKKSRSRINNNPCHCPSVLLDMISVKPRLMTLSCIVVPNTDRGV